MRSTFSGYYRPTDEELAKLWESCIFVLDASMLLNLYRYPIPARKDLMEILEKVADRLWVPYQAALEYQENRLGVIAEQVKRYREVKDVLDKTLDELKGRLGSLQLKRRHSAINPDDLLRQIEGAITGFEQRLQSLERLQPGVSDRDEIRDKLDILLKRKIGSAPESQEVLDAIYEEGKERYRKKQPPGFMDENTKESEETFVYGGLVFRRLYGDLVLWKQPIEHVRTHDDIDSLILVTDDNKEDWWWITDSGGRKTIGPRPELVEEMRSKGGTSQFHMYNSEQFMKFAQEYLGI